MKRKDDNPGNATGNSEDQLMVRYLLAELNEGEREEIARRLFSDEALRRSLDAAEAEILDRYVRRELTPDEMQRVEEHLLTTERQREKLALSRALHEATRGKASRRVAPAVRNSPAVWKWIASGAVAASIVLAWMLVRVAGERDRLRAAESVAAAPWSGPVASLRLQPGVSRGPGGSNRYKLPSGAKLLALQLTLEAGDEGRQYAALIRSSDGREIWKQEVAGSESEGQTNYCPLWIPATTLRPGRYEIALSAVAETGQKLLNSYWFELQ